MTIPFLTQDLKKELDLRVEKIKKEMGETDAILIASSTNMFYLSGAVFRGYIYLKRDCDPLFFTIRPSEAPDSPMAAEIRKPEQIPDYLTTHAYGLPTSVGIELDDLIYSEAQRLKNIFPKAKTVNASAILRKARETKTDYEVRKIREDGMHQAMVYSQVEHCYIEGMTDLELQIEIERVLRREGCLGYLRAAGSRMELNMGSVISGDNADVPSPYDFAMGGAGTDPSLPVGADGVTIATGTTVMVDMNGGFNGYQSDMTRTWRMGDVPEIAVKAHECSRRILRILEKEGKAGVPISQLYSRAIALAEEDGLKDYFMGHRNHVKFIGHGIGIELNEQPVVMERNHSLLREGMTLALEPKFVIPHVGAVGVENTYLVTSDGLENLTVYNEELQELLA